MLYSIELKSLTKSFGDVTAVNDISLSVKKGEIFGFLGPNGAGKSTTIMILTTLLKPTSGQALLSGFDVMTNAKQVRQNIGYVQQEKQLFTKYQLMRIKLNMLQRAQFQADY